MGTITASVIAADLAIDLFDEDGDRFGDSDYLKWINEGSRELVIAKPDANITHESVKLSEGTLQTLADGKIALVRNAKNMGTDGTTEGDPIYSADYDEFTRRNRNWNLAASSATVKVSMYDPDDPTRFWVYPPQPASNQGYVDQYAVEIPADLTAIGSAINIGDQYRTALYHYGMYKGLLVDSKHSSQALQAALTHLQQFYTLIGRVDLAEKVASKKAVKK